MKRANSPPACQGKRMGIDEQTVQEIVRRILSVAKPDKIILFGSAATGENGQVRHRLRLSPPAPSRRMGDSASHAAYPARFSACRPVSP